MKLLLAKFLNNLLLKLCNYAVFSLGWFIGFDFSFAELLSLDNF